MWLIVLELFPALSLYRGLVELFNFSEAAFEMGAYGMRWQSLRDENSGMREVLIIMSIEWLVFLFMSYCTLGGCFCRSPLSIFRSFQERPPSFQSPRLQVQESGVLVQVDNQDINQEVHYIHKCVPMAVGEYKT